MNRDHKEGAEPSPARGGVSVIWVRERNVLMPTEHLDLVRGYGGMGNPSALAVW